MTRFWNNVVALCFLSGIFIQPGAPQYALLSSVPLPITMQSTKLGPDYVLVNFPYGFYYFYAFLFHLVTILISC